jgi:CrcB protein
VCIGGALGSGARYLTSSWAAQALGPQFPAGTLIVNVTGSFLLSVVMRLALSTNLVPPDLRLFLGAGIMGGFTTYSSFNYETLALLDQGRLAAAAANVGVTVVGCFAAASPGWLSCAPSSALDAPAAGRQDTATCRPSPSAVAGS